MRVEKINVSEIKAMTSERLISTIVEVAVQVAHRNGNTTATLRDNEQRAVKELSERFNLDEAKLMELLKK